MFLKIQPLNCTVKSIIYEPKRGQKSLVQKEENIIFICDKNYSWNTGNNELFYVKNIKIPYRHSHIIKSHTYLHRNWSIALRLFFKRFPSGQISWISCSVRAKTYFLPCFRFVCILHWYAILATCRNENSPLK